MIIYSTSPLGAFLKTFLTIGGILAIGAVGLWFALSQRKQGKKGWLGMMIAGLFLLLMGLLVLGVTVANLLTSPQVVTATLDKKMVAEDNCGNGATCTRYVLEMAAGATDYEFSVAQPAFDATLEGSCYQVNYYPNRGLFGLNTGSDQYVSTSFVTRLSRVERGTCQP